MRYRVEVPVQYTNSTEYRQCCRDLFEMNAEAYQKNIADIESHNQEELDPETRDEMAYDESAINSMMDYVLECTKDVPELMDLYKMAAGTMISEDVGIGLAVLFSYDYLQLFHLCLVDFYSDRFNPGSEHYKRLYARLK
jgi:hypothetical protein